MAGFRGVGIHVVAIAATGSGMLQQPCLPERRRRRRSRRGASSVK
ncbi:hypothetical protein [Tunturiibacter lichenicola]